jgi:hypothetical protein
MILSMGGAYMGMQVDEGAGDASTGWGGGKSTGWRLRGLAAKEIIGVWSLNSYPLRIR